jgi:biopolymer transport protein TolQ
MPAANPDMSVIGLIMMATLPVQIIMLMLVLISIVSWTFIFSKRSALKKARAQTQDFEDDFWSGGDLASLHQSISKRRAEQGALARIFDAGMSEYIKLHGTANSVDRSKRAMRAAFQRELDELETNLGFLASAGSVSPYIGLLGTVWGIMHAFIGLANVESATLAAVAPGIAEALIATAMGLFAAIPAVVAYNYYSTDIDRLATRFETFVDEFINILQRQSNS